MNGSERAMPMQCMLPKKLSIWPVKSSVAAATRAPHSIGASPFDTALSRNGHQESRPTQASSTVRLIDRCVQAYSWHKPYALRVLSGYHQFLGLKKSMEDWDAQILVPSLPIEMMWHQHVLDTKNYGYDCQFLCGSIVHFEPDDRLDYKGNDRRVENTRIALRARFGGKYLDEEIWSFSVEAKNKPSQSLTKTRIKNIKAPSSIHSAPNKVKVGGDLPPSRTKNICEGKTSPLYSALEALETRDESSTSFNDKNICETMFSSPIHYPPESVAARDDFPSPSTKNEIREHKIYSPIAHSHREPCATRSDFSSSFTKKRSRKHKTASSIRSAPATGEARDDFPSSPTKKRVCESKSSCSTYSTPEISLSTHKLVNAKPNTIESQTIFLGLRIWDEEILHFKVNLNAKICDIKAILSKLKRVAKKNLTLFFKGCPIPDDMSCLSLGIEENDEMDAILEQDRLFLETDQRINSITNVSPASKN